jgi:ABC-type transport system involved in Fe-S cluster assembly fused permease/ATPase subunit
MLLLVFSKVFTILVPITFKNAIDTLSAVDATLGSAAIWIIMYGLLRFLTTGCSNFKDTVFNKVQMEASKRASLDTYEHLHTLSLRFHIHRKTGTILRAFERGQSGIGSFLQWTLFNILPTILELLLTVIVLLSYYSPWFALVTFITVVGYGVFTISITEWRTKFRRIMNDADSKANDRSVDSLMNFETVKYFNNEHHEYHRYEEALGEYNEASQKSQSSLALLNSGQAFIIAIGVAIIMMMAGNAVIKGVMTVGDFVMVNTYLLQLYQPLNMLGSTYRMIKTAIIDMEQMFSLMREVPEIQDAIDAVPLACRDKAEIEFKNVVFGYEPNQPVLKGVSFTVPHGSKFAIVGATGAGKSTMSRLLYRFYDVLEGVITINGQDISKVTQNSLRKVIGIVPQDTVLFNDTIEYNIHYGKMEATRDEVEEAAAIAHLHDFILRQKEGYQTRVGERGLRLSGGEKQRVAIARAVLKDPPVLIFDEATSALDTDTEREIQKNLSDVAKGRTTMIIAHRLSTIVDCDQILVLKDGVVIERGTHEELLDMAGEYHHLWTMQSQSEKEREQRQAAKANEGSSASPAAKFPQGFHGHGGRGHNHM